MIVSTLRVMSQQGAPRFVIVGFTFGVLLLVFAAASLFDKAKEKRKLEDKESLNAFPAPSFPVPVLTPQISTHASIGTEEIND